MKDSDGFETAPQVLTAILSALNATLPFVVLRNYGGLPDKWDNDVDILVRPNDLPAVRAITNSIFRRSPHGYAAHTMERLNFWSARLVCSDRELQVDFYSGMSKAWCTYAETDIILAARRPAHALFSVPDPTHELLLIAAKELFAYGRIRPRYHELLSGSHEEKGKIFRNAVQVFGKHLTQSGCLLIASALENPTATGRPCLRPKVLLQLDSMLAWLRLRNNRFETASLKDIDQLDKAYAGNRIVK